MGFHLITKMHSRQESIKSTNDDRIAGCVLLAAASSPPDETPAQRTRRLFLARYDRDARSGVTQTLPDPTPTPAPSNRLFLEQFERRASGEPAASSSSSGVTRRPYFGDTDIDHSIVLEEEGNDDSGNEEEGDSDGNETVTLTGCFRSAASAASGSVGVPMCQVTGSREAVRNVGISDVAHPVRGYLIDRMMGDERPMNDEEERAYAAMKRRDQAERDQEARTPGSTRIKKPTYVTFADLRTSSSDRQTVTRDGVTGFR